VLLGSVHLSGVNDQPHHQPQPPQPHHPIGGIYILSRYRVFPESVAFILVHERISFGKPNKVIGVAVQLVCSVHL